MSVNYIFCFQSLCSNEKVVNEIIRLGRIVSSLEKKYNHQVTSMKVPVDSTMQKVGRILEALADDSLLGEATAGLVSFVAALCAWLDQFSLYIYRFWLQTYK